jgi:transcriptional regulator with XRE-family HTH domain
LRKSQFTPLYEAFRLKLVGMRKSAHLTQRQLAKKLRVVRTIVERIEMGERRVDVVELYWLCQAFQVDPKDAFVEVVKAIKAVDKAERNAGSRRRAKRGSAGLRKRK